MMPEINQLPMLCAWCVASLSSPHDGVKNGNNNEVITSVTGLIQAVNAKQPVYTFSGIRLGVLAVTVVENTPVCVYCAPTAVQQSPLYRNLRR